VSHRLSLRLAALALAAALAACAGPRAAGPGGRAPRALAPLLSRDPAAPAQARAALDRALARNPRDPALHVGAALLARRALDEAAEVRHLVAAVAAAPAEPLALVALRRLAELAEAGPDLARAVEAGLTPLEGKLPGLAGYRARVARVNAAEASGNAGAAAAIRAANGAISGWTLAGPFGRLRHLDFPAPIPPERGELPAEVPAGPGLPPHPTRTLPAPDGTVALVGEPLDGDVFALAADLTVARGGRYVVTLATTMSARLLVDGAPVLERLAWTRHAPAILHAEAELAPGVHRVVVKAARTGHRTHVHVSFARADGAPADVTSAPAAPGSAPPATSPPRLAAAPPVGAALAAALEPAVGPVLARVLAARDAARVEREAAKALLAEAAAGAGPVPALVLAARGELTLDDPTLDPQAARARGEADLRAALEADPGHAEARLALADLLARNDRLEEAAAALEALEPAAGGTPAALEAAARVADQRGLAERAEALAAGAIRAGARCGALQLAAGLALRRDAVARQDELAALLRACRDGEERWAAHRLRRGDPRGAAAALAPVVAAKPWDLEPGLALAGALVAAGELDGAAARLAALRAIWPRSARLAARLADVRELAGDAAAARALREEALREEGGDLALRRALALEDGREVLDDLAEDGAAALRAYRAAARTDDTSATMVLDAAALELHPGGAATERTHQIIHVLDARGVEQHGEVSVPPGAELLTLRTRKPDGRTLEPERAGAGKGTVSLAGLEPGDFLEVEWVRAVRGREGGHDPSAFYFQVPGSRLWRSTYAVAAPGALGLAVEAFRMDAPAVAREPAGESGRDVVRVVRDDVPAAVPEPGAPGMAELLPHVLVGTGDGRARLHRALSEAAADAARPTEELRAYARAIRAAAGPDATPAALVRAAHARVSRDVLGSGARDEDASAVLSRGRGSRLQLLRAVLEELGLRARVALVRPFWSAQRETRFPDDGWYGAALLRVEGGGETWWLDPSLRLAPFGALADGLLDCEALVLALPGEPLEVTRTPAAAPVADEREVAVRIALARDGSAELEGSDTYRGAMGGAAKAAIEPLDPARRRQAMEALLARSVRGVTVTEVAFEGEDDPEAPLVLRWRGRAPWLARAAEGGVVLESAIFPARLGARFAQLGARRTPLLVPGGERTVQRVEVVAPDGLAPRAAPPERLDTPFGSYLRAESLEGGTLVRTERIEVRRNRVAPERAGDFAAFAAAVDSAQGRPLVLGPVHVRDPG
jgi:hypothetical protein